MELLKDKIIRIGSKDYPIKLSVRAMIEFESMAGKPLSEMSSIKDVTIIFYCMLKAGGMTLNYDQFMDLIDDNPDALREFNDLVFDKTKKKQITR